MKTLNFIVDEDELCRTSCVVYKDVPFTHSMHGVMVGSITCQKCAFNDIRKMDIESRVIVCKALEEETK